MTAPDYYHILGLASDATAREIRQAYHRLAQRHHPDVNPPHEDDQGASERMALINRAYDVLGDPRSRAEYDRTRQTCSEPVERKPKTGPHDRRSVTIRWATRLASLLALSVLAALGSIFILQWLWPGKAAWIHTAVRWLALDTPVGRRAWALVAIGAAAIILMGRKLAEW
jgi:curved DNA-binding protein CbpA